MACSSRIRSSESGAAALVTGIIPRVGRFGDDLALITSDHRAITFALPSLLMQRMPPHVRHWHGFALRRQVYRRITGTVHLQTRGVMAAFSEGDILHSGFVCGDLALTASTSGAIAALPPVGQKTLFGTTHYWRGLAV